MANYSKTMQEEQDDLLNKEDEIIDIGEAVKK
jgi:hypothetical protein